MIDRFLPSFVKTWDARLKVSHPFIWTLKLPYLLFLLSVSYGLQFLIGVLYPVTFMDYVDIAVPFVFLLLPVGLSAVLWILAVARYPFTQSHFMSNPLFQVGRFVSCFVGLVLIGLQLFVMIFVFNWKHAHSITEQQQRTVERAMCYLDNTFYAVRTNPNKTEVTFVFPSSNYGNEYLSYQTEDHEHYRSSGSTYTRKYYKITYSKVALEDEYNDFVAFHNECSPEYPLTLSFDEIWRRLTFYSDGNLYDEMTWEKYDSYICSKKNYQTKEYYDDTCRANDIAFISDVYRDFERAQDIKEDVLEYGPLVVLWICLFTSFVWWVFSMLNWREILRIVIVGLLLPFVTGLFTVLVFDIIDLDKEAWFVILPVLYLFFAVISLSSLQDGVFSGFKNVCLLLVVAASPFIPTYFAGLNDKYCKNYVHYFTEASAYEFERSMYNLSYWLIPVFGILAILVFTKVFSHQHALPKKK